MNTSDMSMEQLLAYAIADDDGNAAETPANLAHALVIDLKDDATAWVSACCGTWADVDLRDFAHVLHGFERRLEVVAELLERERKAARAGERAA